jgi:hypothetical protein
MATLVKAQSGSVDRSRVGCTSCDTMRYKFPRIGLPWGRRVAHNYVGKVLLAKDTSNDSFFNLSGVVRNQLLSCSALVPCLGVGAVGIVS